MTRTLAALFLAAILTVWPSAGSAEDLASDFAAYARSWVASLNEHLLEGPGRPRCVQISGGDGLGRYIAIDPGSARTSVVPAARNGAPAVGVLRYTETTYSSRAASCDKALSGLFKPASALRVMELFVLTDRGWRPGPVPTEKAP